MGEFTEMNWWIFGAVLLFLLCFGLAYNALISAMKDGTQGYLGFAVVIGVTVTVFGAYYVVQFSPVPLWVLFSCFVASGAPMVVGDVYRATKAREASIKRAQERAERLTNDKA